MFVVKRNQVIITALVVMIAVAGYLNYQDTKTPGANPVTLNDTGDISTSDGLAADDSLDGTALVAAEDDNPAISLSVDSVSPDTSADGSAGTADASAQTDLLAASTDGQNGTTDTGTPGEAIFVNNNLDPSYFLQAKLDREQVRAKQEEMLTNMINDPNLDQASKNECAQSLLTIQQRVEKESAAESMIEAKGFSGVYVRIDDTTVDVVVSKAALSDAEVAQITDIVTRKTGMSADAIRISTIKQ